MSTDLQNLIKNEPVEVQSRIILDCIVEQIVDEFTIHESSNALLDNGAIGTISVKIEEIAIMFSDFTSGKAFKSMTEDAKKDQFNQFVISKLLKS